MKKRIAFIVLASAMLCMCACGTKEGESNVGEISEQNSLLDDNEETDVKVVEEVNTIIEEESNVNLPMEEILSANISDNYMQIGDMLFKIDGSMSLEDVKEQFDNSQTGLSFSYELDPFDGTLEVYNPKGFEFEFSNLPLLGIQDFTVDDILNYRNKCDESGLDSCQEVLFGDERYVKESDEVRLINVDYWSNQADDNIEVYYAKGLMSDGSFYDGTKVDKTSLKQLLDEWGVKTLEEDNNVFLNSAYGNEVFVNTPADCELLRDVVDGEALYTYRSGSNDRILVYTNPMGLRLQGGLMGLYSNDIEISWIKTDFTFGKDGELMGIAIDCDALQISSWNVKQ